MSSPPRDLGGAARTAVVLDSTADFPGGPAQYPNLRVVPLLVRLDGREYRDNVDLDADTFYERLRQGATPTTAAPPPQAFADTYAELLEAGYEHVLSLHLSGKLSATHEAARVAAAEYPGRVTVLDTATVSAAIALCAAKVLELLEQGTSVEQVREYVETFSARSRLVFSLETLDYLQRGGRIGRAQAVLGSVLNVKPVLSIEAGEVDVIGKVRGASKVLSLMAAEIEASTTPGAPLRLAVAQAGAEAQVARLLELVRAVRPGATLELATTFGPVIGTYAGPGAFGMGWIAETPTSARARLPTPGASG